MKKPRRRALGPATRAHAVSYLAFAVRKLMREEMVIEGHRSNEALVRRLTALIDGDAKHGEDGLPQSISATVDLLEGLL